MRATAGDGAGAGTTPATTSKHFRGFSALSLRRHQVASLEPSSEGELHLLDLLHSRLADSLQSLLPPPSSTADFKTPSLILSLPFLHKLLDALLACESDFKSLLLLVHSRNPSLILRPPLDRAVTDLLDRSIKTIDICNAVSLALQSLHLWNRHADIAVSALYRQGTAPRQFSRARRALSKLLSGTGAGLSSSSSSCGRMCRFCSTKRHLQTVASGFAASRGGDSGSTASLALAVHTVTALLHFSLWAMAASFQCGGGELLPLPPPPSVARNMPWAVALDRLHETIVEGIKRERRERGYVVSAGMLAETVALGRSGRVVLEMVKNGDETEAEIMNLVIASQKLEEGLGPLERKTREVFHRLLVCREEVLSCLSNCGNSSVT